MHTYRRKVQYYETDKMGVVHHSNYIRWMEEGRTAFLEDIGLPYQVMEEAGILSPVTGVAVEYKRPLTYGEEAVVETWISAYNGVRLEVKYRILNARSGELAAEAESKHCFMKDGRVCALKRTAPTFHEKLEAACRRDAEERQ